MKEAARWLRWWAKQEEQGYGNNGYKTKTMEYDLMQLPCPYHITEPLPIEQRCMVILNMLKQTEPDLYTVATIEYKKQGEFFERCNKNGGWRDLTTHAFHKVERGEAGRPDFIRYVHAHWGVSRKRYYKLLDMLKARVVHWVCN